MVRVYGIYIETDDPTVLFPLCQARSHSAAMAVVEGLITAMYQSPRPRSIIVRIEAIPEEE